MTPALNAALQGSEDWSVHTGPAGPFAPKRVKAIKLTATTSGSTAMTVTKADNSSASTGELGLHVLEPLAGIKEITAVSEGVAEYRVYYE